MFKHVITPSSLKSSHLSEGTFLNSPGSHKHFYFVQDLLGPLPSCFETLLHQSEMEKTQPTFRLEINQEKRRVPEVFFFCFLPLHPHPHPHYYHISPPHSDSPQWAVFRPTALCFQTLSCLSRELAGLQATKYDVNKLDRGSFHICFRPQTRGARGPHTGTLTAHRQQLRAAQGRQESAGLKDQSVKSEGLRLVGMRCNNKNQTNVLIYLTRLTRFDVKGL